MANGRIMVVIMLGLACLFIPLVALEVLGSAIAQQLAYVSVAVFVFALIMNSIFDRGG